LGKQRIAKIHFKDYTGARPLEYVYTYLLQGTVNWPAVMRELRKIEYDDCVVAEVDPYGYFYDEGIRNTARAMDLIFSLGDHGGMET
jgi:sugar phosphate isomerase/epimerase